MWLLFFVNRKTQYVTRLECENKLLDLRMVIRGAANHKRGARESILTRSSK